MVAKCANPVCAAEFHYLHEGTLFLVAHDENRSNTRTSSEVAYRRKPYAVEYFWLCASCSWNLTLESDDNHGIMVTPKKPTSIDDRQTSAYPWPKSA